MPPDYPIDNTKTSPYSRYPDPDPRVALALSDNQLVAITFVAPGSLPMLPPNPQRFGFWVVAQQYALNEMWVSPGGDATDGGVGVGNLEDSHPFLLDHWGPIIQGAWSIYSMAPRTVRIIQYIKNY